jgi:shikimate kinase
MGAGKSTVGRLLARQLDWRFIDVDDQIEAAAGTTIAELFRAHGEPWFRELEHQTVRQLVGEDHLVLGLGGGAIEDPRTRTLLLATEGTHLIHLEVTLETVLLRCQGTESIRPILADRLNLEARYHRRLPLYRLAHLTLAVDDLSPEAVASALHEKIGLPARS